MFSVLQIAGDFKEIRAGIEMGKKTPFGVFLGYDHLPESAVNTFSADHAYMREKGLK